MLQANVAADRRNVGHPFNESKFVFNCRFEIPNTYKWFPFSFVVYWPTHFTRWRATIWWNVEVLSFKGIYLCLWLQFSCGTTDANDCIHDDAVTSFCKITTCLVFDIVMLSFYRLTCKFRALFVRWEISHPKRHCSGLITHFSVVISSSIQTTNKQSN